MPAHLKQNKYGVWYLVDGYLCKSLKTKAKREAEVRLKQYQHGKFGLIQTPTVQQFYDDWIARKIPPLVRQFNDIMVAGAGFKPAPASRSS